MTCIDPHPNKYSTKHNKIFYNIYCIYTYISQYKYRKRGQDSKKGSSWEKGFKGTGKLWEQELNDECDHSALYTSMKLLKMKISSKTPKAHRYTFKYAI